MTLGDGQDKKNARVERIREIVMEDFERVNSSRDPYDILNVAVGESIQQIEERYQRYERFYRAENFQRLGDIDLTRKALDIRRSLGKAIVEVRKLGGRVQRNSSMNNAYPIGVGGARSTGASKPYNPLLDNDYKALGQIYLRDGMTFLQIGDLAESTALLRRSLDYNSSSGVTLAYLGYVMHKHRPFDAQILAEAREYLEQAVQLAPNDPDVYILRGRFFAKQHEAHNLQQCIDAIERINPAHPMLDRLQKKLRTLKG